MTRALVPLADGVEEMEAVIIIDTLRRAGWEVVAASLGSETITASRGVRLTADARLEAVQNADFDVLALPGGAEGTRALAADTRVIALVRRFCSENRLVGAICAAPLVLQAAGVLQGRRATCHPGVRSELTATPRLDDRVVQDGAIVTSQGPGTAFEFALALVERIDGPAAAQRLAAAMVLPDS